MTTSTEHDACHWSSRLPWYVNGSADRRESAAVEQHVERCARCAAELAVWRAADEAIRTDASAPRIDSDAQLASLLSQIDRRADTAPAGPSVLRRWLAAVGAPLTLPAWAMAAPALLVLVVGTAVVFGPGNSADSGFTTLSSPTPSQSAASDLSVVIDDAVTLRDVRALLASHQLTVVSGPSDAGVWRLAKAPDSELAPLIDALRGDARVLLAEPGATQ